MREFVGVKLIEYLLGSNSLKREALLFHRIAIPNYSWNRSSDLMRNHHLSMEFLEVDWLIEMGIVFEPEKHFDFALTLDSEFENYQRVKHESLMEAVKITNGRLNVELPLPVHEGPYDEFTTQVYKHLEAEARGCALQLRKNDKIEAYPILSTNLLQIQKQLANKTEVGEIIINSLPVPDEITPWEQIIEYRSDPDSQSKFLALRHWMSEVARAELTPAEVEEKLEYLIDQYQKHMRLHRMKTNVGTLETVVTTSAEFLGDLVSFKWGKAAGALFSLRRRRVALLEGELTAPGSEVAYIVKARETFGS